MRFVVAVARTLARKWVEDEHPRGASGGDTNAGSFVAAGGAASGHGSEVFAGVRREATTPVTGGVPYAPDPHRDLDGDGVTDAARVGVPGMSVPATVPRLPNLTPAEREVESRFAEAYEADPQGVVARYREQVAASKTPHTFSTDDAKLQSADYVQSDATKAAFNMSVHGTANAIAKAAFIEHLDQVVMKLPPDERRVLVTAGGMGAGKGYALSNVPETKDLVGSMPAIWDTAGEQNSTELPWVQAESLKRGIRPTYAFVDADPLQTFERVLTRATGDPATGKKAEGRMSDAVLFADSYDVGSRNFANFYRRTKESGTADFIFLGNRGGKPERVPTFPLAALKARAATIKAYVYGQVAERMVTRPSLSPHIISGVMQGSRVFQMKAISG